MKVIYFSGNLGNQVFECAFKDYLKRKNPKEHVYYHVTKYCPPVTVEKFFKLKLPEKSILVDLFSPIIFYLDLVLSRFFKLKLPQKIMCGGGPITEESIFFTNYLQDKYFFENEPDNWLQLQEPEGYSEEYLKYEDMIKGNNAICVHIRRGDYIRPGSHFVDLSATDYYEKAIKYAKDLYPDGKLFFFSDDLDYARKVFNGDDCYFVDCNRGENSYLDIKLMSLAKVNIMANSTFSYWGAYMGHSKKTVIYPIRWYNEFTGKKSPNIMLDKWIGM